MLSPNTRYRIWRGLRRFSADPTGRPDRPAVVIGETRTFFSTALGSAGDMPRLCHYTGQKVTVLAVAFAPGDDTFDSDESEPLFTVKASDGVTFDAFEGELNGWYHDTGQYVLPTGEYFVAAAAL